MPELSQTVATLRADWGLDFARVRRALAALSHWATLSGLVGASGLPRRDVEAILRDLAPFVKTDGDQHHLPGLDVVVGPAGTVDASTDESALTARMAALAGGLPPSRWRLDHVPATPATMARRALHLAAEYELDGASVLCLGDHDLTSLAVGSVVPGAALTVVDIDERILDHVTASAGELGIPLTAAWADLRLALPPSLVGSADLVFTDPPYTTEGMRLFLVRALEALRPTGHERLAFCFGTGERHLVKALEVQALLGDLRLALEAMLPGFNHYDGAEAIGARSDLYICRPTKGARVGEISRSPRSKGSGSRIYTRGPSAEEAAASKLPGPIRDAALSAVHDDQPLRVGDGWDEPAITLPDFFRRLAVWATAARPGPFPYSGTPVINTAPDHGGAAIRTLLLAGPESTVLIVPRRDLFDQDLLAAAYDVASVPAGPGGDPAVLLATRHDREPADDAEAVLRYILLHPGAKVVNAWRDGLLAVVRAAGTTMTKNEARARVAADSLSPSLRRLRTWELSRSDLRVLVTEVARRG
jgi:hypothetical protein